DAASARTGAASVDGNFSGGEFGQGLHNRRPTHRSYRVRHCLAHQRYGFTQQIDLHIVARFRQRESMGKREGGFGRVVGSPSALHHDLQGFLGRLGLCLHDPRSEKWESNNLRQLGQKFTPCHAILQSFDLRTEGPHLTRFWVARTGLSSAIFGRAVCPCQIAHLHWKVMSTTGERFERAVQIMARLRAPGGCPWDREQTFDTIKPYTLEETYEVLEAIDNRDWPELTGELGDLLLQVLFYSQMASEAGHFSVDDVLDRLSNKLVDRHPHVFGDVKADTPAEVLRNWEALKAQEKAKAKEKEKEKEKKKQPALDAGGKAEQSGDAHSDSGESVLAGVSSKMPALMEAYKLSSRAAHVGFDWSEMEGLFAKLEEETVELREELKAVPTLPFKGPSVGPGIAGSGKR